MREKISLCVITHNEPKRLDRCLAAFAPAVDEIVVVHATGSAERNPEIRSIVRKHRGVYGIYENAAKFAEWPHVDDFAAARQKSFDLASNDWCLWVDADDTPGPDFAAALHELLEQHGKDFDGFCLYHDVAGRGIAHNARERLVRRSAGRWVGRIHENYLPNGANLGGDGSRYAQCDQPTVIHLPDNEAKQGNDRNLRILESIPPEERTARDLYHLQGELMGLGRKDEALALGQELVTREDVAPVERYEVLLNIAEQARPAVIERPSPEYSAMCAALHAAYALMPNRREALALLGALHLDIYDLERAEAYLRQMIATPRPVNKPWTHRESLYGWGGEQLWTQLLRLTGRTAQADKIETGRLANCAKDGKLTISVIHPTRGRPEQAARIRKEFLNNAKDASRIEYIFGMEADSEDLGIIGRFRHATSPAGSLAQTNCVAATNAAARASVGDVLIYAQDDLGGVPLHWDEKIEQALGADFKRAALVKIGDGLRKDDLICTPCLTRRAVTELGYEGGIYFDGYRSMFADTELTWRAGKAGWIVPSDIVIPHLHLSAGGAEHETTVRSNSVDNYRQGFDLFCQRNPDYLEADPSFVPETEARFAACEK
jgi:hypothetical protein